MSSAHPDTRTRILQSTWKLLESGVDRKIRISDIAKDVGISRQALYLHFPNRAELLIATTRYIDEVKDTDARLAASRTATSGVERLDAFIEAWADYIPEIFGVAKALMAMQETDDEARQAWGNRMSAFREGCAAAVTAIERDGKLAPALTARQATDLLWTLLSVRNWELLTLECGWPRADYTRHIKRAARRLLLAGEA